MNQSPDGKCKRRKSRRSCPNTKKHCVGVVLEGVLEEVLIGYVGVVIEGVLESVLEGVFEKVLKNVLKNVLRGYIKRLR